MFVDGGRHMGDYTDLTPAQRTEQVFELSRFMSQGEGLDRDLSVLGDNNAASCLQPFGSMAQKVHVTLSDGGNCAGHQSRGIPRIGWNQHGPVRVALVALGIDSDLAQRLYSSSLSDSFASSAIDTSSAAAIPQTVPHVGLAKPRSIRDRVPIVTPAWGARASWVAPRFSRSCRMAAPRAGCGRSEVCIGNCTLSDSSHINYDVFISQ